MAKKLTKTERLIIRVKKDLNVDIENVKRTHAGRNMKASGANTWISNIVGSPWEVGSSHPITDILKAKRISLTKGWSSSQSEIAIHND